MKPGPWQFSIRSLILVVAVVSLAMAGIVIPRQRLRQVERHLAMAAALEEEATHGDIMCMTSRSPEAGYIEEITQLYGPRAGFAQKRAFEHRRLAKAYRRVAYRPWLPAPAEPADLERPGTGKESP